MGFANTIRQLNNMVRFNEIAESMDIINKNQALIVWMVQQQNLEGIDGTGEPKTLLRYKKGKPIISEEYSQLTIAEKNIMSGNAAITDRITHYMSGEFYDSMYLIQEGTSFNVISDVNYYNDIIAHSGNGSKIMELTEENLQLFYDDVLIPELKKRFDSQFE